MSIRPLVIGGEGLSYGLLPPSPQLDALRQPKAPMLNPPPPGMDPRARNAGLAEALSNTPRVEGNSWVEALAAALTGGLRGRTEIDQRQQELADHQRELDQQTRTQKVEDGRQASIADALTAYQSADPNDPQAQLSALVGALSRGDPQDAMPLIQSDVSGRLGQSRERDQYSWQRNYDNENPQAITPAQQAQIDTARRGQDMDFTASLARANGGGNVAPRLRGPDAQQMTRAQTAAESARGLAGIVQEFMRDNEQAATFPGAGVNILDERVRNMSALAARMAGLMRPVGSGATSDFEQRLYARGAPSVDNTREANQRIAQNLLLAAEIANARQFFYEDWADSHNGTLRNAEQAFQQSPEFRAFQAQMSEDAPPAPNLNNVNRSGPPPEAPPQRPPGVPANWVRDPTTGRWRAP